MFGNDQITEAYLLRDDPYWQKKWEELRKSNLRDNNNCQREES